MSEMKRALVSVSDKEGLIPFMRFLNETLHIEIVSTGGTYKAIDGAGIPVQEVAQYTGFPEMMGGRLKTLHPKVHGAFLGRPSVQGDVDAMEVYGIIPFELLVCNLYPFQETITRIGCTFTDANDNIDIGGPSMIRSAAKGAGDHPIYVVTHPSQYTQVMEALLADAFDQELARRLVAAAFRLTSEYDASIAAYMERRSFLA